MVDKKDKAFLKLVEKIFKVKDEDLRAEILIELQKFIGVVVEK